MSPLGTAERQEIIAAVLPRLHEVVERCARRAIDEIADYADVPLADVRQNILEDLGRCIGAISEHRPFTDGELQIMGAIGDRRAEQQIPLEAMLRVYRITIDEVFQTLWEAAERGAVGHDGVMALTREVWRYADQLLDVAVAAYRQREVEQAVADSQQRAALVHRLLLSSAGLGDLGALGARLDPRATYVALRTRGADPRSMLLDLQTPGVCERAELVPYEGDIVGFAGARPRAAPAGDVVVAVGPPGTLATLPRSFAVATRVAETAVAFGRTGVLSIEDVGWQAIARSEDVLGGALAARFVAAADAELRSTVETFLACELSVEPTADALGVHANTVRNRLRRYETLTSCSLRRVDDLCAIRLALLRARLDG